MYSRLIEKHSVHRTDYESNINMKTTSENGRYWKK